MNYLKKKNQTTSNLKIKKKSKKKISIINHNWKTNNRKKNQKCEYREDRMKWNIQMPNNIEIADFSFIEPMFPATKVHRNDIKLRSDSRNGLMDRLRGGAKTAD